jgi:hypothetical protein
MNINLINQLLDSPIAFNPAFARITNDSLSAGMLLSQLFYWSKQMKHEEFYKSADELKSECFLGRTEFETARKKLIDIRVLTVVNKGLPCRTYYKIHLDNLCTELSKLQYVENLQTGVHKMDKPECIKQTDSNVGKEQPAMLEKNKHLYNRDYTETTQENTLTPTPKPSTQKTGEAGVVSENETKTKKPISSYQQNVIQNWHIVADEAKIQFTQNEWSHIEHYAIAKVSMPIHTIKSQVFQLDKWASSGLDIIDSLLGSTETRTLIKPRFVEIFTNDGKLIPRLQVINLRNNRIQQGVA